MATREDIEAWAAANNYPYCAGELYAAAHDGVLPADDGELCAWATAAGALVNGVWQCTGTYLPPATGDVLANLATWVSANPWAAVGLAALAGGAIAKRRRR